MGALSLFLQPLPLSTGDTFHVAEQSQIKEGIVGTGVGGERQSWVTRHRAEKGVAPRVSRVLRMGAAC